MSFRPTESDQHVGSIAMKRVCVFCGSRSGNRPEYKRLAESLGTELSRRGIELVYGGASVGIMGALADAALAAGGTVIMRFLREK